MKPAPFDYIRAESAEEVVSVLKQYGDDARVLAGGQSLMAILNIRLAQPKVLVDISTCKDLNYSRVQSGKLAIGAAATQASVQWRPALASEVPMLNLALPWISHFQIRNRGTVCGSIAHADPSAELPLCLVALRGEVVLRSSTGRRVVQADDFFQGMLTTALRPGEIIEEVRFPLPKKSQSCAFHEVSIRHGDYALVAMAAVMDEDSIELTVGGVSDRARRKRWPKLSGADLDMALNDFAWELQAESDRHATAEYRRHLVRQLGRRLVMETY